MKKKKKKKMNIVLKIFIVIVLCCLCGVGTYFLTYHLDKAKKGGDVKLTVTFDDTTTYVIPSLNIMERDEALNEWPYIMHLSNKGTGTGLYQMIIKDAEDSTIKRECLSYVLYLSDEVVAEGKLKDIKDDVLYTYQIEGKQEQEYSLYIWVSSEIKEKEKEENKEATGDSEEKEEEPKETKYEYKIEFNTIKTGGPGF